MKIASRIRFCCARPRSFGLDLALSICVYVVSHSPLPYLIKGKKSEFMQCNWYKNGISSVKITTTPTNWGKSHLHYYPLPFSLSFGWENAVCALCRAHIRIFVFFFYFSRFGFCWLSQTNFAFCVNIWKFRKSSHILINMICLWFICDYFWSHLWFGAI